MSLAISTSTSPSSGSSAIPRRIVVIGAGMAGIKLAHVLLMHDANLQITILEANNYIGGRMCCMQFEGYTVERGANWISGLEDTYNNPVWKLAQDAKLEGQMSNRDDNSCVLALNGQTGMDITKEYMATRQRFDDIYEQAIETCANQGIQPQKDVDVMTLLEKCGWKKQEEQSIIEQTVQYNVLDVWVANDLRELSAAHDMRPGMNDVDLGKEEVFVEDPRGFNTVLNGMVRRYQRAWWDHQTQYSRATSTLFSRNVQVVAKDVDSDQVINCPADAVVCTVSLGVLQKDIIDFIPPLPDWKKQAINQIGMFCFAKVFARFDEKFQPEKDQFAICTDTKGHYPFWMKFKPTQKNLYMCYIGGNEAERVESLTEEQIKNEIARLFRSAFSVKLSGVDPAILRPTAVAVTNWSKNSRFCGSYSYFPVHALSTIPETDLTCAVTGTNDRSDPKTLYFAGEGFDDEFNGWVQGAYRSGERVAKSIIGGSQ